MPYAQARLLCSRAQAWEDVRIPADMGLDCGYYKWYQNQSTVELAFHLPEHTQPKEVPHRTLPACHPKPPPSEPSQCSAEKPICLCEGNAEERNAEYSTK